MLHNNYYTLPKVATALLQHKTECCGTLRKKENLPGDLWSWNPTRGDPSTPNRGGFQEARCNPRMQLDHGRSRSCKWGTDSLQHTAEGLKWYRKLVELYIAVRTLVDHYYLSKIIE